jgi:putative endonuclease
MFYTYIIFSAKLNKFYIGSTGDDLVARLRKHNTNHKGFTGGKGDWEMKHFEIFHTKEEALKREKVIKSWKSRKLIERLISTT